MIYKGTVVNNVVKDSNGKIRPFVVSVNVEGVHANGDTSDAEVVGSTEFGLDKGIGIMSLLRNGTSVWIQYRDEDTSNFQYPVVIGVVHGDGDLKDSVLDGAEYTTAQVFHTQCGHTILIADTQGKQRIHIYHTKGTEILIDNDGNIKIHGVKDFNSTIDGNYNLNVKGNMTVNCEGAINSTSSNDTTIKGANIRLN